MVAHGVDVSVANSKTEIPPYFEVHVKFFLSFKKIVYIFQDFAKPLKMLCGNEGFRETLDGKPLLYARAAFYFLWGPSHWENIIEIAGRERTKFPPALSVRN